MLVVVSLASSGVRVTRVDDAGTPIDAPAELTDEQYGAFAADPAQAGVRWVWEDTGVSYPSLLRAGIRVERCHDLRLCRAILRGSTLTAGSELARAPLDELDGESPAQGRTSEQTLFEVGPAVSAVYPVAELRRQLAAVAGSAEPGRIRLLLAAESAGALAAAEMRHAGLPWNAERHEALLAELL